MKWTHGVTKLITNCNAVSKWHCANTARKKTKSIANAMV